ATYDEALDVALDEPPALIIARAEEAQAGVGIERYLASRPELSTVPLMVLGASDVGTEVRTTNGTTFVPMPFSVDEVLELLPSIVPEADVAASRLRRPGRLSEAWDSVNPYVAAAWPYLSFGSVTLLTSLAFLFVRLPGSPSGWNLVPADATWTLLVYARNFIESQTFSYALPAAEAGMTSPLWILLIWALHWPFAQLGVELPALAQLMGIALGFGLSALVYRIVRLVTDNKLLAVAAGLLIAIDPTLSYAQVSGSESLLFAFLALGVAWAYIGDRMTLAGILMAFGVVARPEAILLVPIVLLIAFARRLWVGDQRDFVTWDDVQNNFLLVAPALFAAIAWGAYNWSVTGLALPNSYYVITQEFTLFDVGNLLAIWKGYLGQTSYLGGYQAIVTLSLILVGAYHGLKLRGPRTLILIMIPVALVYAFSVLVPLPDEKWSYSFRRYLDPILPFVVVLVAMGVAAAWQWSTAFVRSRERMDAESRRHVQFTMAFVVVALALVPLLGLPLKWLQQLPEYSISVRNIAEVSVPIATWIDENLPPDANVGVFSPGALGYFADRPLVDLTGVNYHETIGTSPFEAASRLQVDYTVAFDNVYVRSWPNGKELASIETESNAILESPRLVVYENDWAPVSEPRHQVRNISLDRLRLIDSLDVGDPSDEIDHDWEMNPLHRVVERKFRTSPTVTIEDDARVTSGSESFRINTLAGRDLIIFKRYDSVIRGAVRVYVNDRQIGVWRFPPRRYFFGEDQFLIPGSFIQGDTVVLRFEHIPDPRGLTSLNSFYYWFYVVECG
ncbi:MAG: hypothetical protein IH861_17020, partial [Chloroflexi bacterium]|nr:hypothetical protein [Chloroflexota bacterium]